jgi:soluble lytic murein transglycosylase-like protein
LLALLAVLNPGMLHSQAGVPESADQSLSAMQQSVARQMASVATAASAAMAGSLKMQRDAIRKQTRAVARVEAQPEQSPEKAATPSAMEVTPAAPATAAIPEAGASDTASGESSFFSSPWPAPEGFAMPNVQVESGECDALPQAEVSQLIDTASSKHAVAANLLRAVMRQESGFRPCALSTAGAMGLMQIMPDTASDLGLSDPFNPAANVDAGARYLKQMLTRYNGDETLALSAYNAGPARVDKVGGIPPISETMNYVSRILSSLPGF